MSIYIFIFLNELFPAFNNLFGLEYKSTIFRSLIIITTLVVIVQIINFYIKNKKITLKYLILLLTIMFIASTALLTFGIRGSGDSIANTHLMVLVARGIPTIGIIPMFISKPVEWHLTQLKRLNTFFTLSFLVFIYNIFMSNFVYINLSFGGVNYNDFSYICAVNIVIGLIVLESKLNIKTSNEIIYILLPLINILISTGVLFVTAGRGAIVTSLLILLYSGVKIISQSQLTLKNIIKYLSIISLILIFLSAFSDNKVIEFGVQRAFSFLDFDSGKVINWENTSGRQQIYSESLRLIIEKPFFGYGIGSFLLVHKAASFSHNIILDILIDGGLIYMLVFTIFIMFIFKTANSNRNNFFNAYGFRFFFLILLKLMSGSTYFTETLFWFGATLILFNKTKNNGLMECEEEIYNQNSKGI